MAGIPSKEGDEAELPLLSSESAPLRIQTFELVSDGQIPLTSPMDPGDKATKFTKGLTEWQAVFLVYAATVGAGIFALPPSFAKAGYVAFFVFLLILCQSQYCGVLLGRCWMMTKERNPDYRECHVRNPYPAIAYEAFGNWAKWSCIVLIAIYTVFVVAAMMLVACDVVVTVLNDLLPNSEVLFCSVPPIIAVIILPFMLLGTYSDLWQIGVLGSLASLIATILIFLQTTIDAHSGTEDGPPSGKILSTDVFFNLIGTCFFVMEAHLLYPTLQHDMANQNNFSPMLAASNIGIGLTFLAATISTFIVYGNAMSSEEVESVLQVLPDGPLRLMCSMVMVPHFFVAMIEFTNPHNQLVEELLDIPTGFCWQRCVIRTTVLFFIVFVAETVPHMGVLIPFLGGTLQVILCLLCPPLFYLRLYPKQAFTYTWESRSVPIIERLLCLFLIGITPVVISIVIYTGTAAILDHKSVFTVPCYINATLAHL